MCQAMAAVFRFLLGPVDPLLVFYHMVLPAVKHLPVTKRYICNMKYFTHHPEPRSFGNVGSWGKIGRKIIFRQLLSVHMAFCTLVILHSVA